MAGRTIRILNKADFDFSSLGANGIATVVLYRALDVSAYKEAGMMLRLHGTPTWSGSALIQLGWQPDGYTNEDPGAVWNVASGGSPTLITFTQGTTTAPGVGIATFSSFASPIQIVMTPKQITAQAAFKFTISVDLALKE